MFPSWNHSRTLRTAVVASHLDRPEFLRLTWPATGTRWPWSGRERPTWPVVLFC